MSCWTPIKVECGGEAEEWLLDIRMDEGERIFVMIILENIKRWVDRGFKRGEINNWVVWVRLRVTGFGVIVRKNKHNIIVEQSTCIVMKINAGE